MAKQRKQYVVTRSEKLFDTPEEAIEYAKTLVGDGDSYRHDSSRGKPHHVAEVRFTVKRHVPVLVVDHKSGEVTSE